MARGSNRPSSFSLAAQKKAETIQQGTAAEEPKQAVEEEAIPKVGVEIETPTTSNEAAGATDDFAEAVRNKRRVKKEDVFKSSSVRLHKDVITALDKIAKKEPHGFKQDFVNYALAKVLKDEYGVEIDLP